MKLKINWRISLQKWIERKGIDEENVYFFLTILTGFITGLMAVFLHKFTHYISHYLGTHQAFSLKSIVGGAILVFISGYITTRIYPSTSGSGIPLIRVWLVARNGYIELGQWLAKLVTTICSLSSGLPIGREGPTVAIAAGIGSSMGTLFSLTKKRVKALVAVGAAGGLAAAFNTPMAAVVFTLEEVVGDLNARMLGAIVISSVVASFTSAFLLGQPTTFTPMHYELTNNSQLFIYLLIGIAAAFIGPLWVHSVLTLRRFNKRLFRGHKLTVIMLTFFLIAALSHLNPHILGGGQTFINEVLLSKIFSWKSLTTLLILKFIATTITYSSGISGGLFMPTLFIGAMLGGSIAAVFQFILPDLVPHTGSFALVGMGAYFAVVVRAPFTSILMIFELTHDYHIILPLMIANITSYMISNRFYKLSIYESLSEQDGVHLPTREDDEILNSLNVEDAMIKDVKVMQSDLTLKEAALKATEFGYQGYAVVEQRQIIGVITANEISTFFPKHGPNAKIGDVCKKDLVTVYPDQSLLVAFHKLKKHNISRIFVVSRLSHRILLGLITAEDIVHHFGYHINDEEPETGKKVFSKLEALLQKNISSNKDSPS